MCFLEASLAFSTDDTTGCLLSLLLFFHWASSSLLAKSSVLGLRGLGSEGAWDSDEDCS